MHNMIDVLIVCLQNQSASKSFLLSSRFAQCPCHTFSMGIFFCHFDPSIPFLLGTGCMSRQVGALGISYRHDRNDMPGNSRYFGWRGCAGLPCCANPLIGGHSLFPMTFPCLVSVPPLRLPWLAATLAHSALPSLSRHIPWFHVSSTGRGHNSLELEPCLWSIVKKVRGLLLTRLCSGMPLPVGDKPHHSAPRHFPHAPLLPGLLTPYMPSIRLQLHHSFVTLLWVYEFQLMTFKYHVFVGKGVLCIFTI